MPPKRQMTPVFRPLQQTGAPYDFECDAEVIDLRRDFEKPAIVSTPLDACPPTPDQSKPHPDDCTLSAAASDCLLLKTEETGTRSCLCEPLSIWQCATVGCLFVVWLMSYFTRDAMFVCADQWRDAVAPHSKAKGRLYLGSLLTMGYLSFLVAKLMFTAFAADSRYFRTGTVNLYLTIVGSALTTGIMSFLGTGTSQLWAHYACFALSRFCQSVGWIGLVEVAYSWVVPRLQGRAMGLLASSYLVGDTLARASLSLVIHQSGGNWRAVFRVSAVCTLSVALILALFVRNKPWPKLTDCESPPPVNIDFGNVFRSASMSLKPNTESSAGGRRRKSTLREEVNGIIKALGILKKEPLFVYTMALATMFTAVRGMFNSYLVLYLTEHGATSSEAALISALFPASGMVASLLGGVWMDAVEKKHTKLILVPILCLVATMTLLLLTVAGNLLPLSVIIALVCVLGFSILGPFTMFAGVLAMDVATKTGQSSGMVAGCFETVGLILLTILCATSSFTGLQLVFGLATGLFVIAFIVAIGLIRHLRNEETSNYTNI